MKRRILYLILGGLCIAALVVAIAWWARGARMPEQQASRSAVVERGTMLVTVSASGSVEPHSRVDLIFESQGRVEELAVEVEDTVGAGDLLARLDAESLALQVQQARAALASAEAQLAQLQAGPQGEEIAAAEANLRAAEAQVSAATAEYDQLEAGPSNAQLASAEAELASAMAEQRAAEEAHDRTMECFTFKLFGEERTICPALGAPEEQARYRLEAADEALDAARISRDELLAGADADLLRAAQANVQGAAAQRDAAQAQLERLLAGPTEEQIAAAEARIEQAQVALELAELSLDKAALHAPFDGVVAEVNVTQGEMTPASVPAITLIDASRFRVSVNVDEIDVGNLRQGQTARVVLDALPEAEISGVVESIAPAATFEGGVVYYEVIIALAPTDVPIRADMTANVTIEVEELTGVLTVPTWAVRVDRSTGQTYVHRRVEGDLERVDVSLGIKHDGVAQVREGLSEGDEILLVQDSVFDFDDR